MSNLRPGPLAGVRIIEVGHMLAGPYCGMLLGDLGADVIKIEMPGIGDIGRTIGPHMVGVHNAYFASLNRNKKSVVLDLASPEGRAAIEDLVRNSDGLFTNLRSAAIKKLGLTYATLGAINPKIACLALTGYGLNGPFADRPAYDYVIQALAGVMALTGDPGGPPVKTGYSVVDNSVAIMGALALVAMIRDGRGGQIDVSLFDVMISQMNYLASSYLNGSEHPKRQANGAHPYIVPAQIFETSDGHLTLFVLHDALWRKFAIEVGRAHWLSDPRFATMRGRAENREVVIGEVASLFRTGSTAFWVDRLAPLGLVVAGVQTLGQALESDLAASREMVVTIPTPEGELRVVGSPFKIEGYATVYRPPPKLGEHTTEILPRAHRSLRSSKNAGRMPEAGPRRALARAISRVADASVDEILASGTTETESHAWRIGVTGPPGSGKSSLIARLARTRVERLGPDIARNVGRVEQLAVLAIDPSSPLNSGAILGDRVRMDAIAADPRIYVRSLSSHGGHDGLAHNVVDLLALADAYGFREIILETVGVGQADHAVRDLVDSLVLVLHPEAGDSIQSMKSGIMEMADIYVINKADLPGAKRTLAEISAVIHGSNGKRGGWTPPILEISREQEEGITLLDAALEEHRAYLGNRRCIREIGAARRRYHLLSLVQRRIDEVLCSHSELLALPSVNGRYRAILAALGK